MKTLFIIFAIFFVQSNAITWNSAFRNVRRVIRNVFDIPHPRPNPPNPPNHWSNQEIVSAQAVERPLEGI